MSGNGVPQHINEQLSKYKKTLNSYSKTYSKLSQFIYQNKVIQIDTLEYIYKVNSELEGLLREIIHEEINGETLRQVPHEYRPQCSCQYCTKDREAEEEEGYYDEEEEDE
jgi:hypothetical protein